MQGNNLVTNDVVTGLEISWDSGSRSEIGFDEVVSSPDTSTARGDQTRLRDLAPLERARSEGSAVSCTLIRCSTSLAIDATYHCKEQYS